MQMKPLKPSLIIDVRYNAHTQYVEIFRDADTDATSRVATVSNPHTLLEMLAKELNYEIKKIA